MIEGYYYNVAIIISFLINRRPCRNHITNSSTGAAVAVDNIAVAAEGQCKKNIPEMSNTELAVQAHDHFVDD